MGWMEKFILTNSNTRLDENNQSEKRRFMEKFPHLFKINTTIKDTEINIQLKPGHYPVKPKAKPKPLNLQGVRKVKEKVMKTGDVDKVNTCSMNVLVLS